MGITFPNNPPPEPGFSQAQIRIQNIVQSSTNQFNLNKRSNTLNENKWAGSLTVDRMKESEARQWKAWLTSMRGQRGTFKVSDPLYSGPYGNVSNQGTVDSVPISSKGNFLAVSGFDSNTTIFKEGDQFEVDGELKLCVRDSETNNSGEALLTFLPALHNTSVSGKTIKYQDPKGTFRLDENNVMWEDEKLLTSIEFSIMEDT